MIFKELIEQLKKVKNPEGVTFELAEELVNTEITSMMSVEMQDDEDI